MALLSQMDKFSLDIELAERHTKMSINTAARIVYMYAFSEVIRGNEKATESRSNKILRS